MKEFFKKWGAVLAFAAFFIAVVVFIFTAGNGNRGIEGHYVKGVALIELDGQNYQVVNDVDSKTYVGSMVSDVLKCGRGEKVGTISSYHILTLAALYRVTGDETGNYLTDSRERIYVKEELAEETKKYFADRNNFLDLKIISDDKRFDDLIDIDDAYDAVLDELAYGEGSVGLRRITDQLFVTNMKNRKEIFAFTADGLFYRARYELFCYEEQVYVTVDFEDNSKQKRESILIGKLLPEELQGYFKAYFE